METIKEAMEKSLTVIRQENKIIQTPSFDFEKLKEMAIRTSQVFEKATMDADNEPAMRQIFSFMFEPKGILVIGNVGSGKTYLMEFFSAAFAQMLKGFKIISANWIVRDCANDVKMIESYGRNSFHRASKTGLPDYKKPITICIDDLGLESTESKIYGNSISILTDILIDRHIMFTRHGMKTHATSNLSVDAIAEKYADRSASRFREMFNVVTLVGKDRRK